MIYFDNSSEEDLLENFEEAVRSSFISKKNGNSSFLVSAPEKMNSEEIYVKLEKKTDDGVSYMVIPFNNYYGRMADDIWDWLADTFPNKKFEFRNKKE